MNQKPNWSEMIDRIEKELALALKKQGFNEATELLCILESLIKEQAANENTRPAISQVR